MDEYLRRYDNSPEIRELKVMVRRAIEARATWDELVRDVRVALPGTTMEIPPSTVTPSFQLFTQYRDPPDSTKFRSFVFRLSHLAPVYDYYETYEHKNGRYLLKTFEPSPETRPLADVVERMITERFGYHRLEPRAGRIVLLHIAVGNLSPGEVTLADALFVDDSSRR